MNDAFVLLLGLLWIGWGILGVWLLRYALKRWVFRFEKDWVGLVCSYAAIAALGLFAIWFVDFSEWNFKGGNTRLIQQIGGFLFSLSPIGLPLWFGGPVVIAYDLAQAWRRSEEHCR